MTVRVEVVTPCPHGEFEPGEHFAECEWFAPLRKVVTEWPPEAIEAAARAIYEAELGTAFFDRRGRMVPFDEVDHSEWDQTAQVVAAALWDHITGDNSRLDRRHNNEGEQQ